MRVRGTCGLQITSFIGRESEVAEVQAAVRAHRLVTLIGVGGVGKTRLATEVAARLADEFPDGVWLFELAAVSDPAAVPDAVAAVLGVTQQPGKRVSDSVAAALEGRVRLLVFDNCEHVLDAAADLVEAILAQSSTVRIVATSREGLGIGDEQLWPVPSLDIGSAAVELFVERARNVAPRFEIADAAEAGAVIGDLPAPRRHPVGDRAGGLTDGVDDGMRGAGSPGSAIPAAGRVTTRTGAPPHAAPRGAVVLRSPRGRRKVFAGKVFGVRRRI